MSNETEHRRYTCCFTGHRPVKLTRPESEIVAALEKEIRRAVHDGFTSFITGMARGVDIWAAEIVLRLREEGTPIRLIAASPYEGFEKSWSPEWQERYERILSLSDDVHYISQHYSRACFQLRNKWMIDRSARVIAVFNGNKGGTKNTISYAKRNDVPVVIIE